MFHLHMEGESELSDDMGLNNASSVHEIDHSSLLITETDSISIPFTSGNPVIEVIKGTLRLFRCPVASMPSEKSSNSSITRELPPPAKYGNMVAIVALPSYMTIKDFCHFLSPFITPALSHIRFLKDSVEEKTMVLIEFATFDAAEELYSAINGKRFNFLEKQKCTVIFVSSITLQNNETNSTDKSTNCGTAGTSTTSTVVTSSTISRSNSTASKTKNVGDDATTGVSVSNNFSVSMTSTFGLTELPNCPVCLERLDDASSGVITTICNHTFHCDCLSLWEDTSCPVCRYCADPTSMSSVCVTCGATDRLWICLICGHVGCGRYADKHAHQHYQETMHTYSMELSTRRVWDYAGDGYVHRLLHNENDGKIVEFPNPAQVSGERSQVPTLTDIELTKKQQDRMDSIAIEYDNLLTCQLESQRDYYKAIVDDLTVNHQQTVEEIADELRIVTAKLERQRQQCSSGKCKNQMSSNNRENKFLRELNASLIESTKELKSQIVDIEKKHLQKQRQNTERIKDLESQIQDLMFYLDSQSKIESSPLKDDIINGKIVVQGTIPSSSASSPSSGVDCADDVDSTRSGSTNETLSKPTQTSFNAAGAMSKNLSPLELAKQRQARRRKHKR